MGRPSGMVVLEVLVARVRPTVAVLVELEPTNRLRCSRVIVLLSVISNQYYSSSSTTTTTIHTHNHPGGLENAYPYNTSTCAYLDIWYIYIYTNTYEHKTIYDQYMYVMYNIFFTLQPTNIHQASSLGSLSALSSRCWRCWISSAFDALLLPSDFQLIETTSDFPRSFLSGEWPLDQSIHAGHMSIAEAGSLTPSVNESHHSGLGSSSQTDRDPDHSSTARGPVHWPAVGSAVDVVELLAHFFLALRSTPNVASI